MKNSMREILREWNSRLTESTEVESLRILDFDDTIAYTAEMIEILDKEGTVVRSMSSEEFGDKTHEDHITSEESEMGYHYGFDEFDDVDIDKAIENPIVTNILRSFLNVQNADIRIVMVLTARRPASEEGISLFLNKIGIDASKIEVVGVGSSNPEAKVSVVERLLLDNPNINRVSFFDDSTPNANSMHSFLRRYRELKNAQGENFSFDVAKVLEDGSLQRID